MKDLDDDQAVVPTEAEDQEVFDAEVVERVRQYQEDLEAGRRPERRGRIIHTRSSAPGSTCSAPTSSACSVAGTTHT